MPQRPKLALLGALGYAFNPGVWYVSAYWGQMDSIYTLFMVVTVLALAAGAVRSAWVAYVLVMTIKIVGASLAPLVIVWSLARHGASRLARRIGGGDRGGHRAAGAVADCRTAARGRAEGLSGVAIRAAADRRQRLQLLVSPALRARTPGELSSAPG